MEPVIECLGWCTALGKRGGHVPVLLLVAVVVGLIGDQGQQPDVSVLLLHQVLTDEGAGLLAEQELHLGIEGVGVVRLLRGRRCDGAASAPGRSHRGWGSGTRQLPALSAAGWSRTRMHLAPIARPSPILGT